MEGKWLLPAQLQVWRELQNTLYFCYTDGKDGNWLMEKDRWAKELRVFSTPVPMSFRLVTLLQRQQGRNRDFISLVNLLKEKQSKPGLL